MTKLYASTILEVDIRVSAFMSTANVGWSVAVNIGGVDYEVAYYFFNTLGDHRHFTGVARITGIPAGAITVTPRHKLLQPSTWNVDPNDRFNMTVTEVRP